MTVGRADGTLPQVTSRRTVARDGAARRCGVLLVAPLPDGPLVGGIATGVRLLLQSRLATAVSMQLFNTYRVENPKRSVWHRLGYQLMTTARFVWTLLRLRPRIVHVKAASYVNFYQGALYAALARILGRQVIFQFHAGDFPQFHDGAAGMRKALIRAAIRLPHGRMALSDRWAEYFRHLSAGRTTVAVPNALFTREYAEAVPNRARFGIAEGRTVLLFVGTCDRRFDEDKGLGELVEAIARVRVRHPELLLVVAGVSSEEEVLAPRLGPAGTGWWSTGVVSSEAKPVLYRSVDIFALPSHFENMPNTLMEAMAAGLPSVATLVGAIPEMIREGDTGFLVSVRDVDALTERIERLVTDPKLRHAIGERAARVAAERFDFSLLEQRMLAEYRRLARDVESLSVN